MLQTVQVYQSGHQGSCVNIGVTNQSVNESHQRWQRFAIVCNFGVFVIQTRNHLQRGHHQLVDHVLGHWCACENVQCFKVDGRGHGGSNDADGRYVKERRSRRSRCRTRMETIASVKV